MYSFMFQCWLLAAQHGQTQVQEELASSEARQEEAGAELQPGGAAGEGGGAPGRVSVRARREVLSARPRAGC